MKATQTSIRAVDSQHAANPRDQYLGTEALSATVCVTPFSDSPVFDNTPATFACFDPKTLNLRNAATGIGTINSCVALCRNHITYAWGYGTEGGQGMSPSGSGTNGTIWTNSFERTLAMKRTAYFGPGETWWNIPQ